MSDTLKTLLKKASIKTMSDSERSAQRQSFAYGNAKISNEDITRELVSEVAKRRRLMGG
jgi:hypothetical protein